MLLSYYVYIVLEEADLQDTGDKWSVGLISVTPLLMIEGCETVWYSVYNHQHLIVVE